MRITIISCFLALIHILFVTYLIYTPGTPSLEKNQVTAKVFYSNDGKYLFTVDYQENSLKVFDLSKNKQIQNFKADAKIDSFSCSPDGKNLTLVEEDNKLIQLRLENEELKRIY